MIRIGQANIQTSRETHRIILEEAVTAGIDDVAPMELAILENNITQGDCEANVDVPIVMTELEKNQYGNEWRTYRERNYQLKKNRGQGLSLIIGQYTQLLRDKMKQDTEWNVVSNSYDPLTLYRLIANTFLGQTEEQYSFATVYNHELGFYAFRQDMLSNPQWYDIFNKKVDVGEAIGVTRQHKVLLEYVAQELYTQTFSALTEA